MKHRPQGLPKTGGRQKGTPNKASAATAAAVKASGLTPLDHMLAVLRDETMPDDVRFDAAKAAAPYVHPKLASIAHTGEGGDPVKTSIQVTFVKPGEV